RDAALAAEPQLASTRELYNSPVTALPLESPVVAIDREERSDIPNAVRNEHGSCSIRQRINSGFDRAAGPGVGCRACVRARELPRIQRRRGRGWLRLRLRADRKQELGQCWCGGWGHEYRATASAGRWIVGVHARSPGCTMIVAPSLAQGLRTGLIQYRRRWARTIWTRSTGS